MTNNRSLRDYLQHGVNRLRCAHIESASLDAQLLAAHVLMQSRTFVLTHPEYEFTPEQECKFLSLIERRSLHEPVAYLVGRCEFMALDFAVNENVLIPRADTETMVEAAISEANEKAVRRVLEIGTGSGCIAVSLAVNCPGVHVTAVDISPYALDIAMANAAANGVSRRVTFVQGDIFDDSLGEYLATFGRFDMLLSNPPYITAAEMLSLPQSVHGFEPHTALLGGEDGLNFYREIARRAHSLLGEQAVAMLEIGCTQAHQVCDIFNKNSFTNISILQDLAGKERVIRAEYIQ